MSESLIDKNIINGKKILFFSPAFFGYEDKIRNKMLDLGAEVDYYDVRAVTNPFHRALLKVNEGIFRTRTEKYYRHILSQIKGRKYDYILFIKCDMTTESILRIYRENFANSKFCLHMWDSIKNIPNIVKKFKYFDFISSFDRNDCSNYPQIYFRPLFYCDEYKNKEELEHECSNDLCFIGTIHSDRWKILNMIKSTAEQKGFSIYYYPYLQSRFIYFFYKLTKSEFRCAHIQDFKFRKLSSKEIIERINNSKFVIDIQHPKQSGLTIRTIEMIGMKKKLITTNKEIKDYDFYMQDNIFIIDREKPELSINSKESYVQLKSEIYDKYSLESWIYEILGINL